MKDQKYTKNFPNRFSSHSFIDEEEFPLYRRINDGVVAIKRELILIIGMLFLIIQSYYYGIRLISMLNTHVKIVHSNIFSNTSIKEMIEL